LIRPQNELLSKTAEENFLKGTASLPDGSEIIVTKIRKCMLLANAAMKIYNIVSHQN